jgi:hypothetical protein
MSELGCILNYRELNLPQYLPIHLDSVWIELGLIALLQIWDNQTRPHGWHNAASTSIKTLHEAVLPPRWMSTTIKYTNATTLNQHKTIKCTNATTLNQHKTIKCTNATTLNQHKTIKCTNATTLNQHKTIKYTKATTLNQHRKFMDAEFTIYHQSASYHKIPFLTLELINRANKRGISSGASLSCVLAQLNSQFSSLFFTCQSNSYMRALQNSVGICVLLSH